MSFALISLVIFLSKRKKKVLIITVVSLIVPYLFFYHGTYRDSKLDITSENIENLISSLDKLDYNPRDDRETVCLINNDYYDTHKYVGIYENLIDGVYIAVEKYEGSAINKNDFLKNSGVTWGERSVENGFVDRYSKRIKLSENNNYTWITSALVATTSGDPLIDCGYLYLGDYYGYFDIQTPTNIYSVTYSCETGCKFLNVLMCVRPKKLTAEKLLSIFYEKPNEYKIDFS